MGKMKWLLLGGKGVLRQDFDQTRMGNMEITVDF